MDISKKIEEIRQKPEYIRLSYVWAAVAVCMFFVFILWIFSVKESFREMKNQTNFSETGIVPGESAKERIDDMSSINKMLQEGSQSLKKEMETEKQ